MHFFEVGGRSVRSLLRHLVMTTAAVSMKRLLVSHDRRVRTAFKLDLRNLGQQLWLGISLSMTIATDSSQCIGIFFKQLRRQSGGAIRRPHCFVRRVLERLGCRLRRVVAFNTGELRSAINAAVLGDVIEVVELNRSKFRIRSQRDYFRRLLSVLS